MRAAVSSPAQAGSSADEDVSSSSSPSNSSKSGQSSQSTWPTMSSALCPVMHARRRPREGCGASLNRGRRRRREGRLLGRASGCALEPFLDPGPGDDVVAVAEAEGRLQRALLVPEVVEPVTQPLELGGGAGVVAMGKRIPELRPTLARQLYLVVNLSQGHVVGNAADGRLIPQ